MNDLVNFPICFSDDQRNKIFCIKITRNKYNIILNHIRNEDVFNYFLNMINKIDNGTKIIYIIDKNQREYPDLSIFYLLHTIKNPLISRMINKINKNFINIYS